MLVVLTFVHHRKWKSAPYLVLTCLSIIGLFLGYAPSLLRPTGIIHVIARLIDIPHLVFIWWFTLSLFQKEFTLKSSYLLTGMLYSAAMLWVRLTDLGVDLYFPMWLLWLISAMSVAIAIHLCVVTLVGRVDDLLDKRRASRIYFVIVIAFVTVFSAISEPLLQSSKWLITSKIITIWPAIVCAFFWMTTFNKKAITFDNQKKNTTNLSERDKKLKDKLIHEMNNELAYKDPNLSIVSLASSLGVHQHRLRSLINQSLGYKNFSEFVNDYRIKAFKEAILDHKNENIQILSLALDSGFKSLSSFNRVFKASEKITPTEFRKMQKLS